MTATDRLVAQFRDIAASASPDTLAMARVCLLDWLGCAIAGASERVTECLVRDADSPPVGGGYPVPGRSERFGLRDAVLVAGAAGHALDYDDGHALMVGHPAVAILPAILGAAMERRAPGDTMLRAIVAGYEAAARVGMMIAPDHYNRGFHATGTVGAIGAAVGAATMMDLSPAATATAIGLAATRAAGLKASFGTDGKPLHAAWASFVGLTAARWAEGGMTGAADILGHRQGIAALTGTCDPEVGLQSAAEPHIFITQFKQHAACGVTHGSIRAARTLHARCAGQEIRGISTRITAKADDICNIAAPATGLQLKFSLRACVAMALLGVDTADVATYSDEMAQRPELRALIAVSAVELDPALPVGPVRVTVELADGTRLEAADDGLDPPDLAGSRAAVADKFVSLTASLLGRDAAMRLRHTVLEGGLDDVAALFEASAPGARGMNAADGVVCAPSSAYGRNGRTDEQEPSGGNGDTIQEQV